MERRKFKVLRSLNLSSLFLVILVYGLIEGIQSTNVDPRAILNSSSKPQQQQQQQQQLDEPSESTTAMIHKEPESWYLKIFKEFFNDIDWQAIEKARQQVEKFIKRVDKILKTFRVPNKSTESEARGRLLSGNPWWSSKASVDDANNFKDMLQRVACFVGYMKVLNNSNEALAELDAAKMVSNLFSKSSTPHWWG